MKEQEILKRFRRVRGSGVFFIDDFCCATGYPLPTAAQILISAEDKGEVLWVGEGMYLLKPTIEKKQRLPWYNWNFDRNKLEMIFSGIPTEQPISRRDLMALTGYSDTLLRRYLKAMVICKYVQQWYKHNKVYLRRSSESLGEIASFQEVMARKSPKQAVGQECNGTKGKTR